MFFCFVFFLLAQAGIETAVGAAVRAVPGLIHWQMFQSVLSFIAASCTWAQGYTDTRLERTAAERERERKRGVSTVQSYKGLWFKHSRQQTQGWHQLCQQQPTQCDAETQRPVGQGLLYSTVTWLLSCSLLLGGMVCCILTLIEADFRSPQT